MVWNRKKRLALVSEDGAGSEVAETFAKLKNRLGVPFLPSNYQAFAYYPEFLNAHWNAIEPVLQSEDFYREADRLRAEAYTAVHNYFQIPDLREAVHREQLSEGAQRELSFIIDFFFYLNAILVLISAYQSLAFEGSWPVNAPQLAQTLEHSAKPAAKVLLIPEESMSPALRALLDDLRRTLELPTAMGDYLALARYPDFLRDFWSALKPNVNTLLYAEHRRRLLDSAMSHASSLPAMSTLSVQALEDGGLSKEAVTSLVHINEAFADAYSATLLNIAFAHIGLEGGNGRGYVKVVA
jgi:hypothetical protein